jgi:hypothetical protein
MPTTAIEAITPDDPIDISRLSPGTYRLSDGRIVNGVPLSVADAVQDPAAFWASLSPVQAWATRKAAPTMLAGPWVDGRDAYGRRSEHRHDAGGDQIAEVLTTNGETGQPVLHCYGTTVDNWYRGTRASFDEAKATADAALVTAGWVLV